MDQAAEQPRLKKPRVGEPRVGEPSLKKPRLKKPRVEEPGAGVQSGSPGTLRPVCPGDASGIAEIYNYYIKHTVVTFEEEPLSIETMAERIREVIVRYPWFVWEERGEIVGYAYAHAWHQRAAYRFAAEDSIYLKPGWERQGIGRRLLERVIGELRQTRLHVVMAAITLPNPASVRLHESFAFKKVGQFDETGYKLGKRLDVGYWELILNGYADGVADATVLGDGGKEAEG
ncbi:MAG: GNAT family N-acetyltransferase [Treponema sp.]|jgi:phosphinothricin acetyltransferase|nr:GNAT family N-acetyltransferase [Treponema sp.]